MTESGLAPSHLGPSCLSTTLCCFLDPVENCFPWVLSQFPTVLNFEILLASTLSAIIMALFVLQRNKNMSLHVYSQVTVYMFIHVYKYTYKSSNFLFYN